MLLELSGVVKAIIALVLVSFLGVTSYVSYQLGSTEKDAEYKAIAASVSAETLKDQEALQQKLDDISYVFFKTSNTEQARITKLQGQLRDKSYPVTYTKSNRSNTGTIIPNSHIKLLIEASSYKALLETANKSCSIETSKAITTNNLVEYTICIIGLYNESGSQLTGVIDAISEFKSMQEQ